MIGRGDVMLVLEFKFAWGGDGDWTIRSKRWLPLEEVIAVVEVVKAEAEVVEAAMAVKELFRLAARDPGIEAEGSRFEVGRARI